MWTLTVLSIVSLMVAVYCEKFSALPYSSTIHGNNNYLSPLVYFTKPSQVPVLDNPRDSLLRYVSINPEYFPSFKQVLAPCVGKCSLIEPNYVVPHDKRKGTGVGVGAVYEFRLGTEAVIPSKSEHEKEDSEEHHSTLRSSDQHIAGVKCARTDKGDCRRTVEEELPVEKASLFLFSEDKKRRDVDQSPVQQKSAIENKESYYNMHTLVDSVSGVKCARNDKGECMKEIKEEPNDFTPIQPENEHTNFAKDDTIQSRTNKKILTVGEEKKNKFKCSDLDNTLSELGCENMNQFGTKPNFKGNLYDYSVSVETELNPQELSDSFISNNNLDDKQEVTEDYTPAIDADQSESDLNSDMCQNSDTGEPVLDHDCKQNINGREKVAGKNQDPYEIELQHEMQYNEIPDQQYYNFVPYSDIIKRSTLYRERENTLSTGRNIPARANNLGRIKNYYSPQRSRYSRLKRLWEVGHPFQKKLRTRAVLDVSDYNPKTHRTTKVFLKTDPLENDGSVDQLTNTQILVPNDDLYFEYKLNKGSSSDLSLWKTSKLRLKRAAARHRTDLNGRYQKQGTEAVKIGTNSEVQETKLLVSDKSQQLEHTLPNDNSAATSVGDIINGHTTTMDNQRLLPPVLKTSRRIKRSITQTVGTHYSDDELSEVCKNYLSQNCDNDSTKHATITSSLSKTDDLRKNKPDKNTMKSLDHNVLCSQSTKKKCYSYFQHINKMLQTNKKSKQQKTSTRTTSISRMEDMKLRQNSQARRLARHSILDSDNEVENEHPRRIRSPKLDSPIFQRLNLPPITKGNEVYSQFEIPNLPGNENVQTLRKYSHKGEKIHSPVTLLFTGVAKFVNERYISDNNSRMNASPSDSIREMRQEVFKREDAGFSTTDNDNVMVTSDSLVREGRRAALGRLERTRNPKENNFLASDTSSDSKVRGGRRASLGRIDRTKNPKEKNFLASDTRLHTRVREGRRASLGRIDTVNNLDGESATQVYFREKQRSGLGKNLNNKRQVTENEESFSDLYGTDNEQDFSPPSYFEPAIPSGSTDLLLGTEDQKVSDLDSFNNHDSYFDEAPYW